MSAGLLSSRTWSREEEKAFENAIAMHWVDDSKEEWRRIALMVPNKTMEQVRKHFQLLLEDVTDIDAGIIPLPDYDRYWPSSPLIKDHSNDNRTNCGNGRQGHSGGKGGSKQEQERRKGIPWTEEEHRLFLLGLDKYGKGDWRSISRNFVISRTPTQVASHAQKYFIRLNSMNRDRRRSSIHDITSVNNGDVSTHQQAPITGQQPTIGAKDRNSPNIPGMGMYGAAFGHPVAGHIGPAIGTPVMLPPGHHPPYVVPASYPMAPMHK